MELTLSKLHLKTLDTSNAAAFAALTYPALRQTLLPLRATHRAVGAYDGHRPIGLALAAVDKPEANVLSVFVDRAYRNRGIGRALVSAITCEVARAGNSQIYTRIVGSSPSRLAFDRALTAAGWPGMAFSQLNMTLRAKDVAEEMHRWASIRRILEREDTAFAPWSSFDEADRTAMEALLRQPEARFSGDPFRCTSNVLSEFSVIIRRADKAIGWLVGCPGRSPLADEPKTWTVDYQSAYVDADLRQSGILLAAYWHAFVRLAEAHGPKSIAIGWAYGDRMVRITRDRFVPIALHSEEVWTSSARLQRIPDCG